jgi:hypothetical protein
MNRKILVHLKWLHDDRNFSWFEPTNYQIMFFNQKLGILVSCFRYQIDIDYIEYRAKINFRQIPISNYLNMRRFADDDRIEYGPSVEDPVQRLESSLRVISSGLSHRCNDILSGDKKWLELLRLHDRNSWEGLPLDGDLANELSAQLAGFRKAVPLSRPASDE